MKFLSFSDVHSDKGSIKKLLNRAKEEDIDFVVCCGDFTQFGRGIIDFLTLFNDLGKKIYLIPGNHEEMDTLFDDALKGFDNCLSLHKKVRKIGDYYFLGHGGGGFSQEDAGFRKIAREWYGKYKGEKIVLVTHQPPFDTKLDLLDRRHIGNKDYYKFIKRIQPKVAISGHLHETMGKVDKIGKTKIINPCWEGMVIELS